MSHTRALRLAVLLAALGGSALSAQQPTPHELKLVPENLRWGYFDASVAPVLRIRSGDRIRLETMVARGLGRPRLAGMKDDQFDPRELAVENGVKERGPGPHPLTGPIYVEGAEPGDALEVRIEEMHPLSNWGVSGFLPEGGTIPSQFPYGAIRVFQLDTVAGYARMGNVPYRIPIAPFFGTIGVAPPPLMGRLGTTAPGAFTGNIDNKLIGPGATLYVPVLAPGALLSIGDAHAAQGDGEVSGVAIETSMRATVQVILHKGAGRRRPWAETPTLWVSMGLSPDLDTAAELAVGDMVDFLVREKKMDRDDAYILCSVACDLHVTQTVDQVKGVHATLLKSVVP
jgi:acetamidase/formamidase